MRHFIECLHSWMYSCIRWTSSLLIVESHRVRGSVAFTTGALISRTGVTFVRSYLDEGSKSIATRLDKCQSDRWKLPLWGVTWMEMLSRSPHIWMSINRPDGSYLCEELPKWSGESTIAHLAECRSIEQDLSLWEVIRIEFILMGVTQMGTTSQLSPCQI